jgi:kynurenine formamidase
MSTAPEASRRWVRRPEGSNWGEFGLDDQVGRLNLLTRERIVAAAKEIREGIAFCLSMPLDRPGGNVLSACRYPPVIRPSVKNGLARMSYPVSRDTPGAPDLICDDAVLLYTQYSTHWDALSHTGFMFDADGDGVPEPRYYNGFRAGEDIVGSNDPAAGATAERFETVSTSSAHRLGIETVAETSVQGRGVMIDLHAHLGREHVAVGYDLLAEIMEKDGVTVETGDIVCLHTGFAALLMEMDGNPDPYVAHHSCAALDGRDRRILEWITDSGLAAIVADNFAVERFPSLNQTEGAPAAPLHEHCLFKLGIHLGELWDLTPLAGWLRQNKRFRFFLTAPPLRLPGATGSPTTPVGTV